MKFCMHCGAEIADAAVICVKCGCSLVNTPNQTAGVNPEDASSIGYTVLCFFFPLIGAILFLLWHKSSPKKAISCALGIAIVQIVGVVVGFITFFLSFSTLVALMSSSMSSYF